MTLLHVWGVNFVAVAACRCAGAEDAVSGEHQETPVGETHGATPICSQKPVHTIHQRPVPPPLTLPAHIARPPPVPPPHTLPAHIATPICSQKPVHTIHQRPVPPPLSALTHGTVPTPCSTTSHRCRHTQYTLMCIK